MVEIHRRGLMLVLSSPSGAGKTTIASELRKREEHLMISTSVTTRIPRPGEQEGKDYFFVNQQTFETMLENEAFLEYAKVFNHYYGTPKKFVFNTLKQGKDIIFDIDWQGTQQLAQFARDDLVSVFILPPSVEALQERLLKRGQDSHDVMNLRMEQAANEISHWPEYDYVIINEDLEHSILQVQKVLHAERLRRTRQLGLIDFVKSMREEI